RPRRQHQAPRVKWSNQAAGKASIRKKDHVDAPVARFGEQAHQLVPAPTLAITRLLGRKVAQEEGLAHRAYRAAGDLMRGMSSKGEQYSVSATGGPEEIFEMPFDRIPCCVAVQQCCGDSAVRL